MASSNKNKINQPLSRVYNKVFYLPIFITKFEKNGLMINDQSEKAVAVSREHLKQFVQISYPFVELIKHVDTRVHRYVDIKNSILDAMRKTRGYNMVNELSGACLWIQVVSHGEEDQGDQYFRTSDENCAIFKKTLYSLLAYKLNFPIVVSIFSCNGIEGTYFKVKVNEKNIFQKTVGSNTKIKMINFKMDPKVKVTQREIHSSESFLYIINNGGQREMLSANPACGIPAVEAMQWAMLQCMKDGKNISISELCDKTIKYSDLLLRWVLKQDVEHSRNQHTKLYPHQLKIEHSPSLSITSTSHSYFDGLKQMFAEIIEKDENQQKNENFNSNFHALELRTRIKNGIVRQKWSEYCKTKDTYTMPIEIVMNNVQKQLFTPWLNVQVLEYMLREQRDTIMPSEYIPIGHVHVEEFAFIWNIISNVAFLYNRLYDALNMNCMIFFIQSKQLIPFVETGDLDYKIFIKNYTFEETPSGLRAIAAFTSNGYQRQGKMDVMFLVIGSENGNGEKCHMIFSNENNKVKCIEIEKEIDKTPFACNDMFNCLPQNDDVSVLCSDSGNKYFERNVLNLQDYHSFISAASESENNFTVDVEDLLNKEGVGKESDSDMAVDNEHKDNITFDEIYDDNIRIEIKPSILDEKFRIKNSENEVYIRIGDKALDNDDVQKIKIFNIKFNYKLNQKEMRQLEKKTISKYKLLQDLTQQCLQNVDRKVVAKYMKQLKKFESSRILCIAKSYFYNEWNPNFFGGSVPLLLHVKMDKQNKIQEMRWRLCCPMKHDGKYCEHMPKDMQDLEIHLKRQYMTQDVQKQFEKVQEVVHKKARHTIKQWCVY